MMAISSRVRFEVLRRDGHRCRYCGRGVSDDITLALDHVVPVALGGSDAPDNLVPACRDCNSGKTSTAPDGVLVAQVKDDAVRWASARKAASAQLAADAEVRERYRRDFISAWKVWDEDLNMLDTGWVGTVGRWQETGLPIGNLCEAVDIAMGKPIPPYRVWAYLCGVVKNILLRLEELTAAQLPDTAAEDDEMSPAESAEIIRAQAWYHARRMDHDLMSFVVDGVHPFNQQAAANYSWVA